MFPIASQTVGSGGAASVTFSSIPQTFTHLQLRASYSNANSGSWVNLVVNSDATASNYKMHELRGDGSTATSSSPSAASYGYLFGLNSPFGSAIVDILDYTNTNKNKVMKTLNGFDNNGSGYIQLTSGLWLNTNAINALTIRCDYSQNLSQFSTFNLYGIQTSNATGA
jgi:hypothetical protein